MFVNRRLFAFHKLLHPTTLRQLFYMTDQLRLRSAEQRISQYLPKELRPNNYSLIVHAQSSFYLRHDVQDALLFFENVIGELFRREMFEVGGGTGILAVEVYCF